MTQPESGVVISFSQLYDEVRAIHAKLNELCVRMDTVITRNEDHEARIRALETRQWRWVGAASVLAAILSGLLVYIVTALFGG